MLKHVEPSPGWHGSVGWASPHRAEVALVGFPVRAHAWVVGSVPSWGMYGPPLLPSFLNL